MPRAAVCCSRTDRNTHGCVYMENLHHITSHHITSQLLDVDGLDQAYLIPGYARYRFDVRICCVTHLQSFIWLSCLQ